MLISLSQAAIAVAQGFFFLLKYFIPEALTTIFNGLDVGQQWVYWTQAKLQKPPLTVAHTHTPTKTLLCKASTDPQAD